MSIKPLNSIAGYSVGEFPSTTIIDANGNVSTANLAVTALANLGNVANVKVAGGSSGQVISTDGAGNLSFVTIGTATLSNGNSNVSIPSANGNINFSVSGNANVVTFTGTGANVAGTGNFTGNVSVGGLLTDNIYHANGQPFDLQQAAGVNNQIQFNTNNNFAASANFTFNPTTDVFTVNGNANVGNLGTAQVLASANVTAPQLISNVAIGTAPFVVTSTTQVANLSVATAGTAGTVTTAAQPNITSVGNLTSLDVTGNLSAGNANLGNVANANFFFGAGNNLSNIQGANVSGQVGNALVAGTVYTNAQPNITSVGTLTDLSVTGNLSAGNANVSGNLSAGNISTSGAAGAITMSGGNIAGANVIFANGFTSNGGLVDFRTANANVQLGSNANVYLYGGSNGQVLQTNGSGVLSWVTTATSSSIFNGNSNVAIPTANGNISLAAAGNTTMVVTGEGANITGYANITGNLVANLANVGNLGVTGGVTAGNLVTNTITGASTGVTITAAGTNQNINLVPTGSGTVNVGNFIVSNVATPVSASDAATKQYVDDVAQGLHIHASCNAATTGTLATITGGTIAYDNGTAGVGATLTVTGGTFTTIDGVALSNGMRILVKNEVAAANNGIYVRTSSTVLTRAADFDTGAEIQGGDFTFVTAGTVYNSTGWVQVDEVTTIGTDPIEWLQFSGAGEYSAGTGLTLTGTVFSITNTAVTGGSYGGGDAVATFTVNAQGQLTAAANVAITANAANLSGTTLNSGVVTSSLTSVGTLGNLAVTGNITSGNVYANAGTIGANLLAGTLTTAAQPNVTSVGSLANLTIAADGNISMSGANATLSGANVVSANLLTGTLTTNAQPNITSVGTLANLSVTGNISGANISATTANLTTANVTGNVIIGNSTVSAATLTTTATTAGQIIAQFPVSGVTGVEFLVKGVDANATGKYSVATVQAVTDGTNADFTVYGGVTLGGFTGSLSVGVAGGNLSLQVTPATGNSTVWTTQYRFI
jgi:hypothetical protein